MAVVLLLASCATRETSNLQGGDAFNEFVDRYYEDFLRLDPLEATQINDNRYMTSCPTMSVKVTAGLCALFVIEARIQPNLESLFNMKPKTGFEIRQTEEFRECIRPPGKRSAH